MGFGDGTYSGEAPTTPPETQPETPPVEAPVAPTRPRKRIPTIGERMVGGQTLASDKFTFERSSRIQLQKLESELYNLRSAYGLPSKGGLDLRSVGSTSISPRDRARMEQLQDEIDVRTQDQSYLAETPLKMLEDFQKKAGVWTGESFLHWVAPYKAAKDYQRNLETLEERFEEIYGRTPEADEYTRLQQIAQNPASIPYFTGFLEALPQLAAIPVENAAVRAVGTVARPLVRAGFSAGDDLSSLGGRYVSGKNPTVQKFTNVINQAKVSREGIEKLRSIVKEQQAGEIRYRLGQDDIPTTRAFDLASKARGGKLPNTGMEFAEEFTQKEIDELQDIVRDAVNAGDLMPFEGIRARSLIRAVMRDSKTGQFYRNERSIFNGYLPQVNEINLLAKVFGDDFGKALAKKFGPRRGVLKTVGDVALDVFNTPRTVFSSYDISAPGRQGAILSAAHPHIAQSAFGAQLKAFGSEKAAHVINRGIVQHKDYFLLKKSGLYLGRLTDDVASEGWSGSALLANEEAFMGRLIQRYYGTKSAALVPFRPLIKGVRASERAYITYLNKLRSDVFYQTLDNWRAAGEKITEKKLKDLATHINVMSGRGSMKGAFDGARPLLNIIVFSPALTASRFQVMNSLLNPFMWFRHSRQVRRAVYGDYAKALSVGFSVLGMASAAGAEVDLDPLSNTFGRIIIGDTDFDFWGGAQPLARFAFQVALNKRTLASGETVDLSDEYGITRADQIGNFARSKLSPGSAFFVDLFKGRTFTGDDPISGANAMNALVPGALQDLYDAFENEGAIGLGLGLPAMLGINVNSYESYQDLQNAISASIPLTEDEIESLTSKERAKTSIREGRELWSIFGRDIRIKGAGFEESFRMEEGALGIPYALRSAQVQRMIDNDRDLQDARKEFEEKAEAPALSEVRRIVFDQQRTYRELAEEELISRAKRGLNGTNLRDAIVDFNKQMYAVNRAVFDNPKWADKIADQPLLLRDVLALKYWTAPLDITDDGALDFSSRERVREQVLAQAKAAGIRESYITGRTSKDWRGGFSENPTIEKMFQRYDKDMDILQDYWSIGTNPMFLGASSARVWNQYINAGTAERREMARGNSIVRAGIRKQRQMREDMRKRLPSVDLALVRWFEYLPQTNPGKSLYRRLYVE